MKIIKDIRIYKSDVENIEGSWPRSFSGRKLNAIIMRIVMKLRENKFSFGEFDHLYINFTTCMVDGGIALAKRSIDRYHPWYRYYDVNVSEILFSKLEMPESSLEIIKLIERVLIEKFSTENFNETLIHSCFVEALEQGEDMLMKFKEKVTSKRKAIIYLRYLDNGQFFPLLRVLDMDNNILFETDMPKMEELIYLGDIQVSSKKVTVKPRKNSFTTSIQPLSFEY